MVRAVLDGTVLASSDATQVVEGNHYFPPDSVAWEHFTETDHQTVCGWKGTAGYYDVTVGGRTLSNVAWAYHQPLEAASGIRGHLAFYPEVTVEES